MAFKQAHGTEKLSGQNRWILAERVWDAFSTYLGVQEMGQRDFLQAMYIFCFGTRRQQARFAYMIYDVDNDGEVSSRDIYKCISLGFEGLFLQDLTLLGSLCTNSVDDSNRCSLQTFMQAVCPKGARMSMRMSFNSAFTSAPLFLTQFLSEALYYKNHPKGVPLPGKLNSIVGAVSRATSPKKESKAKKDSGMQLLSVPTNN